MTVHVSDPWGKLSKKSQFCPLLQSRAVLARQGGEQGIPCNGPPSGLDSVHSLLQCQTRWGAGHSLQRSTQWIGFRPFTASMPDKVGSRAFLVTVHPVEWILATHCFNARQGGEQGIPCNGPPSGLDSSHSLLQCQTRWGAGHSLQRSTQWIGFQPFTASMPDKVGSRAFLAMVQPMDWIPSIHCFNARQGGEQGIPCNGPPSGLDSVHSLPDKVGSSFNARQLFTTLYYYTIALV